MQDSLDFITSRSLKTKIHHLASTSVGGYSSIIQKLLHFTHFNQKYTHISGCKVVHNYTNATVTVHICTVTVAHVFTILIISSLSYV